ncbi:MAG TPA: DUF3060 domain-containing protein [Vicinamibacteria bacterium]|nr:DUF3060 domain-containing protein [Vicinamibacteria bacterium]
MTSPRCSTALLFAATALVTGRPASLAASDVVVGSNQNKTYDCRGGTATVDGGFNVLTLRNCSELVVNGGDNTIDAGVVERIRITGADNRITWTEAADGRRPRIANEGLGNVITSKRAAPDPAGAAKAPAPGTAPPQGPAPRDRVTISGDQVKVEGAEGSVTAKADGTVVLKGGTDEAPPAGESIRIEQDGLRQAYDCRGGNAAVNGDRNDLSFRNCSQVAITGDANVVAVRAVQAVQLSGDGNTLTWERAEDGSRPRISDTGTGNSVKAKR